MNQNLVHPENMEESTSAELESLVLQVIQSRRSKRAYESRPVEPEKIKAMFEAARWAPSSMNEQPWHYIYATKEQPELWDKIFDVLMEGNKTWAKEAPMLIVSMARKSFSRNDRPNGNAIYDLGSANVLLALQATALGLNVHQMAGFDKAGVVANLNIPDGYEVGVVIAVGYPGDPETLPDNLKERELAPRKRNRLSEFVMNKTF
ncbi:MAG: nitroreductase family protein [Cytophagales bacterium]|nr:nitroreductase family protein [Cytophagales bacterium]